MLSRDDEDGDDGDDTASESYLPGGLYPVTFDKEMSVCSYFSLFKHSQHALCCARYAMKKLFQEQSVKMHKTKDGVRCFEGLD